MSGKLKSCWNRYIKKNVATKIWVMNEKTFTPKHDVRGDFCTRNGNEKALVKISLLI